MCPLKREQARRETQQWVMRRLPTADTIVETKKKVGHELINLLLLLLLLLLQTDNHTTSLDVYGRDALPDAQRKKTKNKMHFRVRDNVPEKSVLVLKQQNILLYNVEFYE